MLADGARNQRGAHGAALSAAVGDGQTLGVAGKQKVTLSVTVCATSCWSRGRKRCRRCSVGGAEDGHTQPDGDMDEDVSKQGALLLQHGRFGKKWKRVWAVIYRDSLRSASRLEFFEYKDDKTLRKTPENKKVVRLSDCVRVTEVEMDGCPRNAFPFLLETTDKIFVFATDKQQLDEWTQRLCEIAFPISGSDLGGKRGSLQRRHRVDEDEGMEDNTLYSGREAVCDFRVCVRRTEASDRCRLGGDIVLRAGPDALLLLNRTGGVLFRWPYRYLRRFGRDKTSFSFEAGRRCRSGEGCFEFDTRQGNLLFQAIEGAINLQRTCNPPHGTGLPPPTPPPNLAPQRVTSRTTPTPLTPPSAQATEDVYSLVTVSRESSAPSQQQRPPLVSVEPPVERVLTAVKSLTLDDDRRFPPPCKNTVKTRSPVMTSDSSAGSASIVEPYAQIALGASSTSPRSGDAEYSLPFDSLSSSLKPPGIDPLYDSIDEMKIRHVVPVETYGTAEHIYDEPEGCAAPARAASASLLYDDPEEVRGDAWRIMGSSVDPKGHEYPYDPRTDDYAVPQRPRRVASTTQSTNKEEEGAGPEVEEELTEELQDSPYKNVMIRWT